MNNFSNQALFQEGLDDLFDVIAYISKCHITDKIEEDWLFLLAQREKGRILNVWSIYRESTGSNGTTSSETENSSLKLCIKNMFNNMGHGGALLESIAFNRRVVGSTPVLAAM